MLDIEYVRHILNKRMICIIDIRSDNQHLPSTRRTITIKNLIIKVFHFIRCLSYVLFLMLSAYLKMHEKTYQLTVIS